VNGATDIDPRLRAALLAAAAVSLAAWIALEALSPRPTLEWSGAMEEAATGMAEAVAVTGAFAESEGLAVASDLDPNGSGLIGPAYAELFTTLGQLEAKRTTTTPDVAAVLVHLLDEAGVGPGDTVAVGASGSFPALLVATLTATEALGACPSAILSLGASSHGATRAEFDLLHVHELLLDRSLVHAAPAAISLGGRRDRGEDFEPGIRDRLLARLARSGYPVIHETDLRASVTRRMEVYAGGAPPAAFVNIGGADANVGTDPSILGLSPGRVDTLPLPPPERRGVLHEMAALGVPVVHLLDIRRLALQHGLPWDPVPLPEPGTTRLTPALPERSSAFWAVSVVWLVVLTGIAGAALRGRHRRPHSAG
jgi:poly-gamma-glutamate system protein